MTIVRAGPAPSAVTPFVTQVSRWDRLKDMLGVMVGFARYVDRSLNARLLLVGPEVTGVADDPEAEQLLRHCRDTWETLPEDESASHWRVAAGESCAADSMWTAAVRERTG